MYFILSVDKLQLFAPLTFLTYDAAGTDVRVYAIVSSVASGMKNLSAEDITVCNLPTDNAIDTYFRLNSDSQLKFSTEKNTGARNFNFVCDISSNSVFRPTFGSFGQKFSDNK